MRSGEITVDGKWVGSIDIQVDDDLIEEFRVPNWPLPGMPQKSTRPAPGGGPSGGGHGGPGGLDTGPAAPPPPRGHGPLFRPHIGPRARPEVPPPRGRGPLFRPRIGPRARPEPEAAARGRPRPPTKPEEAPEALAKKAGHLDRSRFKDELAKNPALRDKILRIAANEQGRHPQGTQAILESMMNRAEVRHTSLAAQAKWTGEGGYYAQGNMGKGALENPQHRAVLEDSLNKALGGSNISNYATDNSSGALAAKERAKGRWDFRSTYGGESFFRPMPNEQRTNAANWEKWHDEQLTAAASQGDKFERPPRIGLGEISALSVPDRPVRADAGPPGREGSTTPLADYDSKAVMDRNIAASTRAGMSGSTYGARVGVEKDLSQMHPEYLRRSDAAIKDLEQQGFRDVGIASGYRPPADRTNSASSDWSYRSMHGIGLAGDWGHVPHMGDPAYDRFYRTMERHGFYNPYVHRDARTGQYFGVAKEFNHWQIVPEKSFGANDPRSRAYALRRPTGPATPEERRAMHEATGIAIPSTAPMVARRTTKPDIQASVEETGPHVIIGTPTESE